MNCRRGNSLVDLSSGVNRKCFGGICGGWKWMSAGCSLRAYPCNSASGAWLPAAEVCRLGLYVEPKKTVAQSSSSSSSSYIPTLSFALRSSDCFTECPSGCCPEENWFCCPDNIYCAATAEDCPGTPCPCGILDDNPSPSENELPSKCRQTCCCPSADGTPSNFKNLPWCSGVLCDGAAALSVSSAPLFDPGVCVGTECPAGCCPGENWFCCPDNVHCAELPEYCPEVESLDGSPTTINGVEIDPGRYFDVLFSPIKAYSGMTGGQFVVPEWLGYNLAVYVDSSGVKNAEWVAPGDILNFQSTILLGYHPLGADAPGVSPPPTFSLESVGDEQTGAIYVLTVDPVEGAKGYVFRFNGVAIRPSRIGPAPATQNGWPEIFEGQYQYTGDISVQSVAAATVNAQSIFSVTAATVTSHGTGSFSDPLVFAKNCTVDGDCGECRSCVDGKCKSNCDDGQNCVGGECEGCVDGDCGGPCDCAKLTCCSCQDIEGYTTAMDVPGNYTSLPWVYPYKTCCPPGTTYDGDDLCKIDDPENWGYSMFPCDSEGSMCIQSLLLSEHVECLCDGKCIGYDYEQLYPKVQVAATQAPEKCYYWVCFEDEQITNTVNGKKYTYKVNRCGKRERNWGNYPNYLLHGYNTPKQCCDACDCETTGACCRWETKNPKNATCSLTTQKQCLESKQTPGWSRSFLGVGSTCTNCRRITGGPNPLPTNPS